MLKILNLILSLYYHSKGGFNSALLLTFCGLSWRLIVQVGKNFVWGEQNQCGLSSRVMGRRYLFMIGMIMIDNHNLFFSLNFIDISKLEDLEYLILMLMILIFECLPFIYLRKNMWCTMVKMMIFTDITNNSWRWMIIAIIMW